MTFFRTDLARDKAITLGQCLRHYGLTKKDLNKEVTLVKGFLSKTNYSRLSSPYYFATLDKKVGAYHPDQLRHLAGVAEMRHALRVPVTQWASSAGRTNATLIPDGVWTRGQERIAIEYDTGSYSWKDLHRKTNEYAHKYGEQIWGTPSKQRKVVLEELLGERGYRGTVLLCLWW
jgi:Replication-relaxation